MPEKSPKKSEEVESTREDVARLKKQTDRLTLLTEKLKERNEQLVKENAELGTENEVLQDLAAKFDLEIREVEKERSDEFKLIMIEIAKLSKNLTNVEKDLAELKSKR